jgi:hypothetical protein
MKGLIEFEFRVLAFSNTPVLQHSNTPSTSNLDKKRRPEGRLFSTAVRVQLYFGVNSLFENQLLVLFEFITVFQTLVLVLAD